MSLNHSTRSRGYLPHWEGDHVIYFVTFRLADSLPKEVLTKLRAEGKTLEDAERYLDDGCGHCYLRDPRIAKIVVDTLRHFHGERYQLLAWCVMPNHVHVLFSALKIHKLAAILHSWKSFSAGKANRLLERSGAFWQREYFDHLVRNESSLMKLVAYIQENPQKAGLQNWPWVSSAEFAPALGSAGFGSAICSEEFGSICSAGFQPAVSSSHKSKRRQDGSATKST